MPTITVIIPAYNQSRFLSDSLNSIIAQTYTDWECIIINDGSTDNTQDVVKSYLNKIDKFLYIEQSNRGLAATRNRGLDEAAGKYIQFLDADDVIGRTKFEKQLADLSKTNNLALSYTDYFSSTESDLTTPYPGGRYLPPTFVHNDNKLHDLIIRWEAQMSIPVHCFLFDARFFKDYGIRFDETLPNHEDWDCWMNIFRLNPKVYYIPEKLATYRIHTDSMVYDWDKMEKGFMKALEKQRNSFDADPYYYDLLTQKIKLTKTVYKQLNPSTPYRLITRLYSFVIRYLFHH